MSLNTVALTKATVARASKESQRGPTVPFTIPLWIFSGYLVGRRSHRDSVSFRIRASSRRLNRQITVVRTTRFSRCSVFARLIERSDQIDWHERRAKSVVCENCDATDDCRGVLACARAFDANKEVCKVDLQRTENERAGPVWPGARGPVQTIGNCCWWSTRVHENVVHGSQRSAWIEFLVVYNRHWEQRFRCVIGYAAMCHVKFHFVTLRWNARGAGERGDGWIKGGRGNAEGWNCILLTSKESYGYRLVSSINTNIVIAKVFGNFRFSSSREESKIRGSNNKNEPRLRSSSLIVKHDPSVRPSVRERIPRHVSFLFGALQVFSVLQLLRNVLAPTSEFNWILNFWWNLIKSSYVDSVNASQSVDQFS